MEYCEVQVRYCPCPICGSQKQSHFPQQEEGKLVIDRQAQRKPESFLGSVIYEQNRRAARELGAGSGWSQREEMEPLSSIEKDAMQEHSL